MDSQKIISPNRPNQPLLNTIIHIALKHITEMLLWEISICRECIY